MMTTPAYRLYLSVRNLQTLSPLCAWSANSLDLPHAFVTDFLFTNRQFSAFRLHHNPQKGSSSWRMPLSGDLKIQILKKALRI